MTALARPQSYLPSITIFQNRDDHFRFDLYLDDETPAGLAIDDVLSLKIWQTPGTVNLDVRSDNATANGSIVIVDEIGSDGSSPAVVFFNLHRDDATGLSVGLYNVELGFADNSETGDPFYSIVRGQITVEGSPSGDIGP